MARYTGPKTKVARKFGEAIFGEDRSLEKRNYIKIKIFASVGQMFLYIR